MFKANDVRVRIFIIKSNVRWIKKRHEKFRRVLKSYRHVPFGKNIVVLVS